jgi:hypothetical protein
MPMVLVLSAAVLSPGLGLVLLLWLAHLEDTLPRDVEAARRQPEPAPVLAIAVTAPAPPRVMPIPAQRPAPAVELSPSAGPSRSAVSA